MAILPQRFIVVGSRFILEPRQHALHVAGRQATGVPGGLDASDERRPSRAVAASIYLSDRFRAPGARPLPQATRASPIRWRCPSDMGSIARMTRSRDSRQAG